jgi:hypothetical protein
VSITDQLHIGKYLFSATERGKDSVRAYLESRRALTLGNAILNGQFRTLWPASQKLDQYEVVGKYSVYGGSASSKAYGGKPESRVLEVEQIVDTDNRGNPRVRFVISIRVGEGVLGDQGAIKPKDMRQMISQRNFLTLEEAYEMASILVMHTTAYYGHYMEFVYDERGEVKSKDSIDDMYKSEYRPADASTSETPAGYSPEIPLD